jgi:hypothetical protein
MGSRGVGQSGNRAAKRVNTLDAPVVSFGSFSFPLTYRAGAPDAGPGVGPLAESGGSGGEAHARGAWGVSPHPHLPLGVGAEQRGSDAQQTWRPPERLFHGYSGAHAFSQEPSRASVPTSPPAAASPSPSTERGIETVVPGTSQEPVQHATSPAGKGGGSGGEAHARGAWGVSPHPHLPLGVGAEQPTRDAQQAWHPPERHLHELGAEPKGSCP